MRSHGVVAAVIAAVFIIRPATSLRAAEGSNACSLLTQARVSAVLGVPVGAGAPIGPGTASPCGWAQPGDTSHSGKRVVLDLFGPMGRLTPVDRFNNAKTPVKGITKTPAAGIGDDAYYITTSGFGTGLSVKKGSSVFQIRVYGFAVEQIQAMEKTLAQDVLAKL
jgi:hypothetical protein